MGEWRYSSTIFYLGTMEVSGQFHAPDALLLEKVRTMPIG
jgi:hypothetical protein